MPLPIVVPHMNGFPGAHRATIHFRDNVYCAVEVEVSLGSTFGDLVWDNDVWTFVCEVQQVIGGYVRRMSLIAGPYLLDRGRNLFVIASGCYRDESKHDRNGWHRRCISSMIGARPHDGYLP